MRASLQQVSNAGLPGSLRAWVRVINPRAEQGGNWEFPLFVGVHHREGCREQAVGTLSDDSYLAKCVFLTPSTEARSPYFPRMRERSLCDIEPDIVLTNH